MNKSRFVIFGSNGFIGSSLVNFFKQKKINYVPLSRKDGDLLKSIDVDRIYKKLKSNDILIITSSIAPCKNLDDYEKNITIAKNLADKLSKKKFKKIILISSDAVYPDSKSKIKENLCTYPTSWHGLMHISREFIFNNMVKSPILILRPTLIYGPGDTHNGYGPNKFFRDAIKSSRIFLFGKGEERRDHIFIDDLVKMIFKLSQLNATGSYNLCTGKTVTFLEIAKEISKIIPGTKLKFIKRNQPMPHNGYRPLSNQKTLNKLSKFKFTSLKNAIKISSKREIWEN